MNVFQNVHWPIYNFIKRYSIVSFRIAGAWIRKFYSIVGPKITNMKISIFSKSNYFELWIPKLFCYIWLDSKHIIINIKYA